MSGRGGGSGGRGGRGRGDGGGGRGRGDGGRGGGQQGGGVGRGGGGPPLQQGGGGRGGVPPPQQSGGARPPQQAWGGQSGGAQPPQQAWGGQSGGARPPQQAWGGQSGGARPPQQSGGGQPPQLAWGGPGGARPPQQAWGGRGGVPPQQQSVGGRGQSPQQGGGGRGGGQPPQQVIGGQPPQQAWGGRGQAPGGNAGSIASSSSSLARDFQQSVTLQTPAPIQVPVQSQAPIQVPVQQPAEQVGESSKTGRAPVSSKAVKTPPRPGYGTRGDRCSIRANHFLVEVADVDLRHYDVTITPEVTSKKVCRDIISTLVGLYSESHLGKRRLAYDGKKSAFTSGPLPFETKEFAVKLLDKEDGPNRREREFKVSIKYAAKPDIHHLKQFLLGGQHDVPHETVQALDVVLRATPSINYEVVGRSFFHPRFNSGELSGGLEYWKGFYQSLRPTQMGLSLNVDMSARAFYKPMYVSAYVSEFLNRDLTRPLSDQDRVKVKRALKGIRIEVTHTGFKKRHKVSGLSTQPLSQLTFPDDASGTRVSVIDYFRGRYQIDILLPFLPALQVGSDAKPKWLPMEICKIVEGQRYSRKLNEKQVTALLKATCQRPHERERVISTMVLDNDYNRDEIVNDFGIHVNNLLTSIDARVLPAPLLKYHHTGRETEVHPQVGQWNMIDKKMVNGGKVDHWTCANFSRNRQNAINDFCNELVRMCQSKGMEFNPQAFLESRSASPHNIEKTLFDIHSEYSARTKGKGQLDLLIIILPEVSGSYGKIKRLCETELGIVSQCCQPKHVLKFSRQYFENVSLKINVKAGGRNTVLRSAVDRKLPYVGDHPTIIFGADVTHPPPGEDSSASIAAVVASMDWPEVTKYRGLVSAQPHRQEIIQDLYNEHTHPQKGLIRGGMIREHLMAFYRSTRQKPGRIIFYRDGVSEGQFAQVLYEEMDAIRKACVSLDPNYVPRVTFVVVQKRHHTRLFAANHANRRTIDRSGNILPGTVVDTMICHPTDFDFYLCSHAGIQGTSRPTHYHVLYDENNFTPDALQGLTNDLCYTYARCTRSVSVVPPAYYAHLAAFRARYYVEGDIAETESTGAGGRNTRERINEVRPLPAILDKVKDVMFYC